MAIREIAATIPATLSLRGHAKDARELAVHLEATLSPVMRAVSLAADWIEHRQLAITAAYSIVDETAIFADATSGAVVVTLPASTTDTINRDIHVKKTDSGTNAVTITPQVGDTIDGMASIAITTAGESFHLLADGLGAWRVLSTVAASSSGGIVAPATAAPIIVNLTPAAVGTSVKYAREDHRHLFDVTISPTGASAWTGTHAWTPAANTVPLTVNVGALTSANFITFNPTTNPDTVVTYLGNVGVGDETPTANVSIRARNDNPILTLGPLAWWVADDIVGVSNGALVSTAAAPQWPDRSGNGHHLTALGLAGGAPPTADATKGPKFRTAGATEAITAHAAVSLEGSITVAGSAGYFSMASPKLNLVAATGWTVFMIWRDYSNAVSAGSRFLGSDTNLGDSDDDYLRCIGPSGGPNVQRWETEEGASQKNFTGPLAHTDGNDVEVLVGRVNAGGLTTSFWLDGVLQTPSADTIASDIAFRYVGLHLFGTSILACYGKSIVQLGVIARPLTGAEITTLNTYLLAQVAGASSGFTQLTHWKDGTGAINSVVDKDINFGLGTTAPEQKLHVVGKMILQNSSSAFKATLDASLLTGNATFDLVDPASSPATIVTGTGAVNSLTIWGVYGATYTTGLNWDGAVGNRQLQIGDVTIATTPGIKLFAQSPYTTTYTLSSTTGVVTFDTPSSGGRYVFTGNTSSEIATFTGGNGISALKYNKVTITSPVVGSTLTIDEGATFRVRNSLDLIGTGGTTQTFPTTNAVIARTDAAQTFTGVQTFSSQDVHNAGVSLGSNGTLTRANITANSGVTNLTFTAAWSGTTNTTGDIGYLFKPNAAMGANASILQVQNSAGTSIFDLRRLGPGGASNTRLRVGFDASNYLEAAVTSVGIVNVTAIGSGASLILASAGAASFASSTFVFTTTASVTFTTPSIVMQDGLVISNAANTTGLKIGAAADKLGFYSVAPVVQPVNTVAIDTALTNLGLRATGGLANFDTDVKVAVVGKGLYVKEGANATMGIATLVAGVAVVTTTKVTANSRIFLTRQTVAGTVGTSVDVTARTAATSFTITAAGSILDTSTVAWLIMEPA